ncbi:Uncharacterized protein BP5553_04460 [Venustampulla echinocandica]|uniref:ABC transporter domain-containing protein n=1 Tax=Venustampulla echinocandica TaxID=2656787 RepID=A0A370TNC8_9HELO|nr:Uncharacterized protein BP5553_04460 [Venustampulla echinocandica]RDL37027.1 Uncharacterized protein BP5553_04460 [Venustampulla echinocandica]
MTGCKPPDVGEASPEHTSLEGETPVGTPPSPSECDEQDRFGEGPDGWSYNQWLHEYETKKIARNIKRKHLALTWKNLSVIGVDSHAVLSDDVLSSINPVAILRKARGPKAETTIIHNVSGQVRPGEMMLVLGRPGSGCTSFLKAVANKRGSFKKVEGDVFYGTLDGKEAEKYRGTILYNSEEDIHFPNLTVEQTVGFAVRNRVPRYVTGKGASKEHVGEMLDVLPDALKIGHTRKTLVGNEFVRGVSGGERKRVSIAEVMAANGSITCWDNATRGLDASSALEFIQALRVTADRARCTALVTLYQAGNGIFDLFDKVLVLDGGRQIYYGPANRAKGYFEDLGFICPPGANVADFLTSVTVPLERQIKPGYELLVPKTTEALESSYRESAIAKEMNQDIEPVSNFAKATSIMVAAIKEEQPKRKTPFQSSYTVPLAHQIQACAIREFQILRGDTPSLLLQQTSAIIQALLSGSLFYNLPTTSAGAFVRGGAIFYPLVFYNLAAMSEVVGTYFGRPILNRHRDFSLYRPTAYVIARLICDIPFMIAQVSIFCLIFYFMAGFQMHAGKFFTFWILTVVSALTFVAMYRMIGSLFASFDNASKVSGFWSMACMVYAGFIIPFNAMPPWFKWIFWLNPIGYALEALQANEFGGLRLACVGQQLIPNGPGYDRSGHQTCTIAGATPDGKTIIGEDYMRQAYGFNPGALWQDFAIVIVWGVVYTIITAIAQERMNITNSSKSSLVFKRGGGNAHSIQQTKDEEKGEVGNSSSSTANTEDGDLNLAKNESVFTWDHLSYTVSVPGGHRKLLDGITGWVKPGTLGALMGSSGAGKTTLLDVLAQRKDVGVIQGEVLVDGRPLPTSFQRSAGYCEQMDVHEGTATVKEALVFSARLRQPADTPDDEKLHYVDSVIELLELGDFQDALIGTQGTGLSVEQRKRVTIGVELAAKPTILLFLDEPTSGLDGQSAFNVVRFLRKLTAAGQAVLCTIHQPSALLFDAFDQLLLLAKGGQTVYFGETGKSSSILLDYFAKNGAPCDPNANPAEHIIDVVSGASGGGRNWHDIWLASPECAGVNEHMKWLKQDLLSKESKLKLDDAADFATSHWAQLKIVTHRQCVALWRNPDYIHNKIILHIISALFSGFSFWMLGDSSSDLQLRLLAVFNILFVAVGVIAQLQPLFLHYRDIFETREKKSKMYSWYAFVTAQLVAEIPYLIICGTLYFCCWYFTVGLPVKASTSGQVFLHMILFEFLYTATGQGIAAISPNSFFAALMNPTILGAFFINFCGVLVPYSQLTVFWRYWFYYLNPYNYLIGGFLTQILFDVKVQCDEKDLVYFKPPDGQTCGQYMADFFKEGFGYVANNSSTTECGYCPYANGGEYAKTLNLNERYYGWRDTGIMALFCISTYGFVFLMMKFRSKKTKSAKME